MRLCLQCIREESPAEADLDLLLNTSRSLGREAQMSQGTDRLQEGTAGKENVSWEQ